MKTAVQSHLQSDQEPRLPRERKADLIAEITGSLARLSTADLRQLRDELAEIIGAAADSRGHTNRRAPEAQLGELSNAVRALQEACDCP